MWQLPSHHPTPNRDAATEAAEGGSPVQGTPKCRGASAIANGDDVHGTIMDDAVGLTVAERDSQLMTVLRRNKKHYSTVQFFNILLHISACKNNVAGCLQIPTF
jgi:hypothetical protein